MNQSDSTLPGHHVVRADGVSDLVFLMKSGVPDQCVRQEEPLSLGGFAVGLRGLGLQRIFVHM